MSCLIYGCEECHREQAEQTRLLVSAIGYEETKAFMKRQLTFILSLSDVGDPNTGFEAPKDK